jgi:hypothetical protein
MAFSQSVVARITSRVLCPFASSLRRTIRTVISPGRAAYSSALSGQPPERGGFYQVITLSF